MEQSAKKSSQKENVFWLIFSLFFAMVSLFFISLEVKNSQALMLPELKRIYIAYFLGLFFLAGFLFYLFGKSLPNTYLLKRLFLIFLPAELILLFGFWNYPYFNTIPFYHFFKIPVNLYPLLVLGYFFCKYAKYQRLADFFNDFREPRENRQTFFAGIVFWFKNQGLIAILILATVLVANFSLGINRLGKFAAVDEPLWTSSKGRIQKFWNNVADGEFYKTMVSDKPGITVALISGIGLTQVNPDLYVDRLLRELPDKVAAVEKFNFAFRFPILVFNLLMLLAIYIFSQKLLGKTAALISFIFIGLSPILLGMSLIVNPDSLIWTFFPLSLLSYFLYLENRTNKYLFWSGIFLGFSILTKYVANILYIFYFLLIFLEYIIHKSHYEKEGLARYFRRAIGDYFVLVFLSFATFFLFLPAAWVDIRRLLEGTILSKAFLPIWPVFLAIIAFVMADIILWKNKLTEKIMRFFSRFSRPLIKIILALFLLFTLGMLLNTYGGMKFYDLESIIASPKSAHYANSFLGMMLANFYSLFFGLTPLAFLAIIGLSVSNLFLKKEPAKNYFWAFYLILFMLIYYTASVWSNVSATLRYQIVLFPLALLLAGIGLNNLIQSETIKKYILKYIPKYILATLLYFVLVLFSAYSLWSIRPFYFSYANAFLPPEYILNLKDMGGGSYEAAQYLNSLPNAEKLTVWTDKRGVCYFFKGSCRNTIGLNKGEANFDYFVVSSGRESRTTKMTLSRFNGGNDLIIRLDKLYAMDNPDFYLKMGSRPDDFVKVIKAEKLLEMDNEN